jgi:hypothetical protein
VKILLKKEGIAMRETRITKGLICGGIITVILFTFTLVSGLTINKAVPCPQGINEKEVMDTAIAECQKLGYEPKHDGNKVVLSKGYEHACVGSIGTSSVLYKITPAVVTGEDGRKVLTIGGEYIGKPMDKGHRGECFECEMDNIEKAVKAYLETR